METLDSVSKCDTLSVGAKTSHQTKGANMETNNNSRPMIVEHLSSRSGRVFNAEYCDDLRDAGYVARVFLSKMANEAAEAIGGTDFYGEYESEDESKLNLVHRLAGEMSDILAAKLEAYDLAGPIQWLFGPYRLSVRWATDDEIAEQAD
jgi:hypothetical protein